MAITDVEFMKTKDGKVALCIIHDLSDELKLLIRKDLSTVCHGAAKVASGNKIYSYKSTLKAFLSRYETKTEKTKTGMIGELLCHITLYHFYTNLKPASPFFNMEEGSIKKGFDLIAIEKGGKGFYFTEVKSGKVGKLDKDKKIHALIDLAKTDLEDRIPNSDSTLWYSAINNVELSLESGKPEKTILINCLSEFFEAAESGTDKTGDARVILVPVLFESTTNTLDLSTLISKSSNIQSNKTFCDCIVFAIQKSTLEKVEEFLKIESTLP